MNALAELPSSVRMGRPPGTFQIATTGIEASVRPGANLSCGTSFCADTLSVFPSYADSKGRQMTERKTLRPSTRFDVFKRDDFSCSYCGRKAPAVTLEVDHIIPIAEGGTNHPDNLTTSCWDCNRGKGARPLDAVPPALSSDLEERAELMREREAQMRAFTEAQREAQARRDADYFEARHYWEDIWGGNLERWEYPWEAPMREYIDKIGVVEVMRAMDVAAEKFRYLNSNTVRYFCGVARRRVAEYEGRIVTCVYCKKPIVVDTVEDARSEWHHVSCKEKHG